MIEQIQYITQGKTGREHSDLCMDACKAGVRWVQLRMKDVSHDDYLIAAHACRQITQLFGAKLIINDNIDIALEVKADGVHLGLSDMSTKEAKEMAPDGFIVGGTSNTVEHIVEHINNGADYVGVGPFRFTTTKNNLSPTLGFEGYQKIIGELNNSNISIPLIAIGGIEEADIQQLQKIGVHGIAMSGLLTQAENKTELIKNINKTLKIENT